jgi:hypothetical protein
MDAMALEIDAPVALGDYVPAADQRIVMRDVGWAGYEALLAMRGAHRRPRMTYLDGAGIHKLAVYAPLGVPEVWIWQAGAITVHVLGADGYEEHPRSLVLPMIDLAFLASWLDRPASSETHVEFERALAAKLA